MNRLGLLAFAPLFLFALWMTVYFVILSDYITQYRLEHHEDIVGTTAYYFDPLFALAAVNAIVALGALLYFVMHVWTKSMMPTGNKMVWVAFLATFNILAFPVYWHMHVRHATKSRNNTSPALT